MLTCDQGLSTIQFEGIITSVIAMLTSVCRNISGIWGFFVMANYHWNSLKSWYAALSVVAVFGGAVKVQAGDGENPDVEIFVANAERGLSESGYTTVYKVDRIAQLQQELSIDLPADSESAKALALQRFQRMNTQLSGELENAAKGLVQAMQYGIDRYPAIVFDGQAVVYGLTDIHAATQLYQRWQAGSAAQ